MKRTTIKAQKVTFKALRGMAMGDSLTFLLPTRVACNTGRIVANRVGRIDNVYYRTNTDFDNQTLTITKLQR